VANDTLAKHLIALPLQVVFLQMGVAVQPDRDRARTRLKADVMVQTASWGKALRWEEEAPESSSRASRRSAPGVDSGAEASLGVASAPRERMCLPPHWNASVHRAKSHRIGPSVPSH
jgi:hypothetical protein